MDMTKRKLTILSGAGISAESGVKTFRDAGGLWEGHDVMEVASPQGWRNNPEMVLDFYNQRRRQLKEVEPNAAHRAVAYLQEEYDVTVVTQNVDDLHERGGSQHIVHLHGELLKARSTLDESLIYHWPDDLNWGDTCEKGSQLRPHIVWFGEAVPMLQVAAENVYDSDVVVIVGTSMQVYPAAGLIGFAQPHAKVFYIDPDPHLNFELQGTRQLEVIAEKATVGMQMLLEKIG